MVELTGISLGDRQKQLNAEINNAANNNINFDEIKSQPERSDVDKLYKIGVASKYKDVEYIMEILKSGDSLYISKALKCIWLYNNEYSHIINPKYLHDNIFPFMSLKMTRKFLTTISLYLRDERAIDFYKYCNKIKLGNIAMKFLLFTPESFKIQVLKDVNVLNKLSASKELVALFLGNSFDLAEAYYYRFSDYDQASILYKLRQFYSISDVKYLKLLTNSTSHWSNFNRFGLRISKDIIKKHKDELYKKPMTYLHVLNKSILVQYITIDDAKFFAKTLIANEYPEPTVFWNNRFCRKYEYILNKIPSDQRLSFIKDIFTHQYPNVEFEMSKDFYNAKLYKLMTPEERDKWALRHVQSDLELLGSGKDFLWYRYVLFDKAFGAIKKYIHLAVNIDARTEVISVLVESAKTDKDLEILFDYYYKRHVNEQQYYKQRFVDAILSEHNVYNFGESCWNVFNKILYSLDVYNVLDSACCKSEYKNIALIYHIIHGKDVPEALTKFIDSGIYMYSFKAQTDKLSQGNVSIVYNYLLKFYLDKVQEFDDKTYNDQVKYAIRKYIHFVLDLMFQYKKPKDGIPEIVDKYIQLDFDEFRNHLLIRVDEQKLTQERLIAYLKNNKEVVISNLSLVKKEINDKYNSFKFNMFLKKIRTYFSYDLATIFLKLFKEVLDAENPSPKAIKTATYGIFELADLDFKADFMAKHVPVEAKIDHSKINRKTLCVQEAICNMVCYSRPPVPLSDVTKYIKGDYVQYCLPLFNSYLAKLPKPLCLEFVKSLLDRPLSVQKHGLRMAFECFSLEDLRKIMVEVWNNTINVSLKSIIYTYLYNKIRSLDEHDQNELFEDLKLFTRSLSQEDDVEVFKLITSNSLPKRFIGEYIEIAWDLVDSFPTKIRMYIERRKNVIDCIHRNIYLVKKEVIEKIIYDHVNLQLKQEQIKHNYDKLEEDYLVQSKWDLLYKYVTFFTDENDLHKKTVLVMFVLKECLKLWDKVDDDTYIIKQFVSDFLSGLEKCSYNHEIKHFAETNVIFQLILKELQDTLSAEEIHEYFWSIRICILARNVISDGKKLEHNIDHNVTTTESLNTFAKEFAKLFIESIESRQYFLSLFDVINDTLDSSLRVVLTNLNYTNSNLELKINSAIVLVCVEVLEHKSHEAFMFAAKMLPCDIDQCIDREGYLNVLQKLRCCDNTEVKFYLYRKFVTSDYTFRDYILPLRQDK